MLNNAIVRTFIVIVRVSLIYFRCYTQRHGSFTENLKRETRILIFFSEIVTSLLNAQNTLFRLLFGASPSLYNSSAVDYYRLLFTITRVPRRLFTRESRRHQREERSSACDFRHSKGRRWFSLWSLRERKKVNTERRRGSRWCETELRTDAAGQRQPWHELFVRVTQIHFGLVPFKVLSLLKFQLGTGSKFSGV